MTDRVELIVESILYTPYSVDEICRLNGFKESDLTLKEHDELYEAISKCGKCNAWVPASDCTRYDFKYGFVCGQCYEELAQADVMCL